MQINHQSTTPTSQAGASMEINPTKMAAAMELEKQEAWVAPDDGGSQTSHLPWPALASAQGCKVLIIEDK